MQRTYLLQLGLAGCGGFVGSAARFALGGLAQRAFPMSTFPWGTLAVNVLGCFVIGILGGLMELRQVLGPGQRIFLMIGVLGGFTTFSTFAYETLGLLHGSELPRALANAGAHLLLGLAAVWIGYLGAQAL
jgi:fluoride exporter